MQHATLRTISYTLKTGCALTIKNHQCTTTSKIFLHFEDLGIYNLLMSITDKEVFKDYYKILNLDTSKVTRKRNKTSI